MVMVVQTVDLCACLSRTHEMEQLLLASHLRSQTPGQLRQLRPALMACPKKTNIMEM